MQLFDGQPECVRACLPEVLRPLAPSVDDQARVRPVLLDPASQPGHGAAALAEHLQDGALGAVLCVNYFNHSTDSNKGVACRQGPIQTPCVNFKDWLAQQIKERDWGVAEAAGHIGVSHSMVSRYLNGKARPERKAQRAIVKTFGIDRDELEAMVDSPRPPLARSSSVDRNVEIINWDAMTPEEGALLRRLLRGALDVFEARERGER